MSHLKPVPTPPKPSYKLGGPPCEMRRDASSGSIILECQKAPPYLALLSTPSSEPTADQNAASDSVDDDDDE